ncbi:hypothetical protein LS72_009225 [Helicobacter apodemus]|uniref:Uncharacterized protein n=1 Tax=Helicobacter apodemus TaxID=135569 RepID=A0A4U8UDK7_9HELI|nr:hypothetical protein [Helicobacter apodemus]TLE13987.1 hypothetical protein LS72_009225 [Helicobacter apodemus]
MNHSYALQEITKKLETIKESWQIYEIFEAEKKRFNEEYQSLQKDKEELIQTFNEVSAKNALLKVQNNELEEKNKALENALKEKLHLLESSQEILKLEKSNPKIDFSLIKVHLNTLGNLLSQAKVDLPPKPIVLKKLEISYQKRKKLLAAPANDYVSLQEAMELFYLLEQLLEQIQAITLEYSKINSEIAYQENRENGS